MVRRSRKKSRKSPQEDKKQEDISAQEDEEVNENKTRVLVDSSEDTLEETLENSLERKQENFSGDVQVDSGNATLEGVVEKDTQRERGVEEGIQGQNTSSLPFQNSLQKKLFDIRLRMNEGRKLNSQAVEEELKTNHFRNKGQTFSRKPRQQRTSQHETSVAIGLKDKFWRETAEQAEQQLAKEFIKRRRSGQKLIGETIYGEDNLYRAYEKRLTRIPANEIDPAKAQEEMDPLEYGQGAPISPDRVEKMVQELEETEERRRKFSKWHKFDEETADISFINERNRRFNEKIARSFDEYTQEIRQNLERGTALP